MFVNQLILHKLLALGYKGSAEKRPINKEIFEQLSKKGFNVFPIAKEFIATYYEIQCTSRCIELKIPIGFNLNPMFRAVEDYEGFEIVSNYLGENLCPIGNTVANNYKNLAVSDSGMFYEFWDDLCLIGKNEEEFFETLLIDPVKNVKRFCSLSQI